MSGLALISDSNLHTCIPNSLKIKVIGIMKTLFLITDPSSLLLPGLCAVCFLLGLHHDTSDRRQPEWPHWWGDRHLHGGRMLGTQYPPHTLLHQLLWRPHLQPLHCGRLASLHGSLSRWAVGTAHGPHAWLFVTWEIWTNFLISNFRANFSNWWLRYLLCNWPQVIVMGPYYTPRNEV